MPPAEHKENKKTKRKEKRKRNEKEKKKRKNIIPEQFTVKAHPALFGESEEGEGGEPKKEAFITQQTLLEVLLPSKHS